MLLGPVGSRILNVGFLFVYVGPGAIYLVTAIYLKQRKFWAVVVGLVLGSIQLLVALGETVNLLYFVMRSSIASFRGFGMGILISLGILIFIDLALGQLIYHLALSFEAIKYTSVEQQHGFEPLMTPQQHTEEKRS